MGDKISFFPTEKFLYFIIKLAYAKYKDFFSIEINI